MNAKYRLCFASSIDVLYVVAGYIGQCYNENLPCYPMSNIKNKKTVPPFMKHEKGARSQTTRK